MPFITLIAVLLLSTPETPDPGALLLVGGGELPDEVMQDFLKGAGGANARIVIIPHTADRAEKGNDVGKMWKRAGARRIIVGSLKKSKVRTTLKAIQRADLIWLPGGSQTALVAQLKAAKLVEPIRQRFNEGAFLGGSGSGAAAIPKIIVARSAESRSLRASSTELEKGLGFLETILVDNYFTGYRRFNRLLVATLDFPELLGIGIDSDTGIVVNGGTFQVIGRKNVVVIDARDARKGSNEEDKPLAATGIKLHVLKAGSKFDIGKRAPVQ